MLVKEAAYSFSILESSAESHDGTGIFFRVARCIVHLRL